MGKSKTPVDDMVLVEEEIFIPRIDFTSRETQFCAFNNLALVYVTPKRDAYESLLGEIEVWAGEVFKQRVIPYADCVVKFEYDVDQDEFNEKNRRTAYSGCGDYYCRGCCICNDYCPREVEVPKGIVVSIYRPKTEKELEAERKRKEKEVLRKKKKKEKEALKKKKEAEQLEAQKAIEKKEREKLFRELKKEFEPQD